MTLQTWWLFVMAVFLLSGTPGPNMLHILQRSVDFGVRRTVAAMAGCLAGLVSILAASAAGLTALLLAIPGAFEVLRWLGTGYLVWLGIKAWRADPTPLDVGDDAVLADKRLSAAQLFRGGFAISISNPKALLFAAAFFPQFVSAAAPKPPQFAILVLTFAVIECLLVRGLCVRRPRPCPPSPAARAQEMVQPADRYRLHRLRPAAPALEARLSRL
jgi:threonine/homoserine/homoserine lactone efflux protein